MLTGRSIYIFQLDVVLAAMGSNDAIIAKAVQAKISSLWIKIAESATPSANVRNALGEHFRDLVAKGSANGIGIFGWHVPYCADEGRTDNEIKLLTRLVADLNLAGVVIDNEDGPQFFKGNAATAARYGAGLHAAMQASGKIVAMSSNDIISWHPGAYATVVGQYIDINAPQVYYGGSHSVASRLDQASRENRVIRKPFFPVGVCVVEPKGENEGAFSDPTKCATWAKDFIGLVSQSHHASPDMVTGYGFWDWDQSTEEFWRVLYDTAVFIAPAADARSGGRADTAPAFADSADGQISARTAFAEPEAASATSPDCLVYEQSTGRMSVRQDGTMDSIGVGYSGSLSGGGRNDPSKQCVKMVGPIPRGRYTIGPPILGPSPYSLRLTPDPMTDMCGRGDFLIHGDSSSHPGNASEGCIILSRSEREAIVKTGIKLLIVVNGLST